MNSNLFLEKLNSLTSPYFQYQKYGEVFIRCKVIDDNTVEFLDFISLNPFDATKIIKLICNLADEMAVVLIGMAYSSWIGPSITNDNTFRKGMDIDRLLKWYKNTIFQ